MFRLLEGNVDENKDMFFHNLRFGVTMGLVHETCSEKGDGVWGGPGLDLWPPWNLGPAPTFQPDFEANYVSQQGFVGLLGPSPSCQQALTPRPWKKVLVLRHMPHSKWSTGSSHHTLGPFADGFGISFMLQVPPFLPLRKWISINLVHQGNNVKVISVPTKAKDCQPRALIPNIS